MGTYNYNRNYSNNKYDILYGFTETGREPSLLKKVQNQFPGKSVKLKAAGNSLDIEVTPDLDAGEQSTLDTLVEDHRTDPVIPFEATNTSGDNRVYLLFNSGDSKDTHDYFQTNNRDYYRVGHLDYEGTGKWVLKHLKAKVSGSSLEGTAYFRIFDVTNAQEILSFTWTGDSIQSVETSSFTNLPTSSADLEIQMKVGSNGDTARIHSLLITD